MRQLLLFFILTIVPLIAIGQNDKRDTIPINIYGNSSDLKITGKWKSIKPDWRTVTVKVFDCEKCPSNYGAGAETFYIFKNQPKTINQLRARHIKKLKKYAAKWNCKEVFVDLNHLWTEYKTSCSGNCYFIIAVP